MKTLLLALGTSAAQQHQQQHRAHVDGALVLLQQGAHVIKEAKYLARGAGTPPTNVNANECEDWCESEMFVKVEANTTSLKNLSSWAMKCSWAYCGGCTACSDPTVVAAEARLPKKDPSKHISAQSASCDEWCSSEVFQVV